MTAATAGAAILFLPSLAVAGSAAVLAWRMGWEARRLRNFALGAAVALPLGAMAITGDPAAPLEIYGDAIEAAADGRWGEALADAAIVAVPLGWGLGALWWGRYRGRMRGGKASLEKAARHEDRQWRYKWRAGRAAATSRTYPLVETVKEGPAIVLGPTVIEDEGGVLRNPAYEAVAQHPNALSIPYKAIRQHLVIVADPGAGKTTLLRRLSAGALVAAWRQYSKGEGRRPLIMYVNCKGGPSTREEGEAWTRDMIGLGLDPARVGLWPDETRLNMWSMKAADQVATLHALVKSGHEHYEDLRESLLHLVCEAPVGAPKSSVDFLSRINEPWLRGAWAGHPVEGEMISALYQGRNDGGRDGLLKYSNLFRHLGRSLDGGRHLGDLDALYAAIEGTRRPREAQAQASALMQLVRDLLSGEDAQKRDVLIWIDEYSAISDAGGSLLRQVVEQMRSLGASAGVIAQNWQGLGPDDHERERLVTACSGGRLLMRSTNSERLAELSGTTKRVESARHTVKGKLGDEGSARLQDAWLVNPQRVRTMQPGDVVYAAGGRATWGSVVELPEMRRPTTREALETAETVRRRHVHTAGSAVPAGAIEAGIASALGNVTGPSTPVDDPWDAPLEEPKADEEGWA